MNAREERGIRLAAGDETVACSGEAFAPALGTYDYDPLAVSWTTLEDSGLPEFRGGTADGVARLVAAAVYELGFAREAGPLSTWSN